MSREHDHEDDVEHPAYPVVHVVHGLHVPDELLKSVDAEKFEASEKLHDLSKVHQLGRPVNTGVVVRIENQIKREGSHEVNKKKRLAVLLGNLLPFEAEVTVIFPSDNVKASEEVQKDVNCEAHVNQMLHNLPRRVKLAEEGHPVRDPRSNIKQEKANVHIPTNPEIPVWQYDVPGLFGEILPVQGGPIRVVVILVLHPEHPVVLFNLLKCGTDLVGNSQLVPVSLPPQALLPRNRGGRSFRIGAPP
mmetsp:Transcript_1956/g.3917  ORF Transcript_1956/g.3917 Transcript_1956/m.3917 type:complete len:247 (-) Transcript_1956:647-1387(-)